MQIRIERWSEDRLQRSTYTFALYDPLGARAIKLRCVAVVHEKRESTRKRTFSRQQYWDAYSSHYRNGDRPAIPEDVKQEALQRARDHITLED